MHYLKLSLSILFLLGTFSSLIYSFILIAQFLGKRLTKREAVKKNFWVMFCGVMSMFFAYFVWIADWNLGHWLFMLVIAVSFSLLVAFSTIASFLSRKDK